MSGEWPPRGTLAGDMARLRRSFRVAYESWCRQWRFNVGIIITVWVVVLAIAIITHTTRLP